MIEKTINKKAVLEHIIKENLEAFDSFKEARKNGGIIDYDYEIARDRKSAIVLKAILAEVHLENTMIKYANATDSIKRLQNEKEIIVDSKTSYGNKLNDPRWQTKRMEILQRDNFTCQECGKKQKKGLHVHHLKYDSHNPWETSGDNLVTLCKDCHDKKHNKMEK